MSPAGKKNSPKKAGKPAPKPSAKAVRATVNKPPRKAAAKEEPAAALSGWEAKRRAYVGVLERIAQGKKATAAELQLIREVEQEEREQAARRAVAVDEPNLGALLEEDLEEWTLRDGVVRGKSRRLSVLAAMHQVTREDAEKALWKIQRRLLAQYGFEGTKKSGPLTGNEALAIQWVRTIYQIGRASREWELRMEELERARIGGSSPALEEFAQLVVTLKQLSDKRDTLSLRVRELSAKERKAGTGRGQRAHSFSIVMRDGSSS